MKKQTIEKLSGLAAISTAMGSSADAALVASVLPTGGLVLPTTVGTINWDIDNDSTNEFEFGFSSSTYSTTSYSSLFIKDLGNTRVAHQDGGDITAFQKLTAGAKLGTASDALDFNAAAQNRNVVSASSGSVSTGFNFRQGGWSLGDTGYFGFKFTKGGNTHYGWAEMTISSFSQPWATINEAWYNDTPDASVTVGVVPEPAEVGFGLGVLALGAAGLRRMRENRKSA